MENFKVVLRKRILILTGLITFIVVLQLLVFFDVFGIQKNDRFVSGVLNEFQMGLLSGGLLLAIILLIRYRSVINDNIKLKKCYHSENDERKRTIKQKSGGNVMLVSSVIIIVVGIIAGYFNETVFFTLIACAVFQLYLVAFLKFYYSRKY